MKKGTAKQIAETASRVLADSQASKAAKTVAASALTQSKAPGETTSAKVAKVASRIMQDGRFSDDAKSLAASVLSQRKK